MAKIVARQVARKLELDSTFGNGSCKLSRNYLGRCRLEIMIEELLHKFSKENFGDPNYLPLLHRHSKTAKPLALLVKRKRSIWKCPFGKKEIIILDGLEKYVDSNENDFLKDVKSKIKKEQLIEKGSDAPAARCIDDNLGDLQLGKVSQEYISDPDLREILRSFDLDTNKMSCLQDQELLLVTSVVYSERFEVQGNRKHEWGIDAELELPSELAKVLQSKAQCTYKEKIIPPGVATRNAWGPILFKYCRVQYNETSKKLEMVKGEFAGKSAISRATNKEDDVDAGIPIDLDADDNYLPDYFTTEDIKMMNTIYKTVLMTEKNREQRKARVRKYLGWFERMLTTDETKILLPVPLTSGDCKFLQSMHITASTSQRILDFTRVTREDIQSCGIIFKLLDDLPDEDWTELEMTLDAAED
ncbi:uncharacterized protein [Montipora foliosa]|uniref:uncharacterized protein n=1 Tax=Montipora foliosa TaxID=591990 RepID=UPI0035F13193